jgi:hypothetical protein
MGWDVTTDEMRGVLARSNAWAALPWADGWAGLGLLMIDLGGGCRLTAHDVDGTVMVSADGTESLGYTWVESPADALRVLAEHEAQRALRSGL